MNTPPFPFKVEMRAEDNHELVPEYRDYMEKTIESAYQKRWAMIESLMLLYIAGTGFRPDQLELCEQVSPTEPHMIRWFIRPLPTTKVNEEGKADPCHVRFVPL